LDRIDEDISVIVTVFNHERTLARTLDSILRQEMPYTSRIYCLNDASTDRSGAILEDYAARYPSRINVYMNPRNLGSGRASQYFNKLDLPGRYWCLLEGDDFWIGRDKLRQQLGFLDANPDYIGCSCNTLMLTEETGERRIIAPDRNEWNLADLIVLTQRFGFYVHTSGIVWRHIHKPSGFYWPPEYAEPCYYGDVMLMHVMLRYGGKMKNIPVVMSFYRVTGVGVWSGLSESEQRVSNKYIVKTLRRTTPFKYKLYRKFPWLAKINAISKYMPHGPING